MVCNGLKHIQGLAGRNEGGGSEDRVQLSVISEQMVNTPTRDNTDRELENADVVFAAEERGVGGRRKITWHFFSHISSILSVGQICSPYWEGNFMIGLWFWGRVII